MNKQPEKLEKKEKPVKIIPRKMRDYLNSEEQSHFLFMKVTSVFMPGYRKHWLKYNGLTSQEHKAWKMCETYMKKFVALVESRLSFQQKELYDKKIRSGYAVKILDKYTQEKLRTDIKKGLQQTLLDTEDFYQIVSDIMYVRCRGCQGDYKECYLHQIFVDNFIPEPVQAQPLPNCRYAYLRDDVEDLNKAR